MDIVKIDGVEVKPIANFEEFYGASYDGRIWSYKDNDWMELFPMGEQQKLCVNLSINGEDNLRDVHRVIAETWIPSYGLDHVKHKDGDKYNNRVDNLYWKRAYTRVRCAETEQYWSSVKACSRDTGYTPSYIRRCMAQGIPTYQGLHFEEV